MCSSRKETHCCFFFFAQSVGAVGECGKEATFPPTWIVALQSAEATRFFPNLPFKAQRPLKGAVMWGSSDVLK